jgi:predicted O-methyltransferase YrrM
MSFNTTFKQRTGWGIFHQDLFRPSLRFINYKFERTQLTGIEIGVEKGINALQMLKHMNIKRLYLIEPYPKDIMEIVLKDKRVRLIEDFSEGVAHSFYPESVDFVYIDGNHDYHFVRADLENYYPIVKKGGVVCGHDINSTGVLRALSEFAVKRSIALHTKENDWWFVK